METDTYDSATCPACDLGARLLAELGQARSALGIAEREFHLVAARVAEGAQDVPFAARRMLLQARRKVTALEHIVDDLAGTHTIGGCHAVGA